MIEAAIKSSNDPTKSKTVAQMAKSNMAVMAELSHHSGRLDQLNPLA